MSKPCLDQQYLRDILQYNPCSGAFFWRATSRPKASLNKEAGYVHKTLGYRIIMVDGINYYAHRLAYFYVTGRWPEFIDHINRIRDDNRWGNIRECSRHENQANMSMHKDNKSGYIGVSWNKKENKWVSNICRKGCRKRLGSFNTKEEAIAARKGAERCLQE